MQEAKWNDGDLVPNGAGDFQRLEGSQALIQRVLFKLSARRGEFPFLPRLGSRLHTLAAEKPGARQALCLRYVCQALEDEDVAVTGAHYQQQGEQAWVKVYLQWQGETLEVTAGLGGTGNEKY